MQSKPSIISARNKFQSFGIIPALFCGLAACAVNPSTTTSSKSSISAVRLEAHVQYLASDMLEGRGAGYPGEKLAAAYIATKFKELGLHDLNGLQDGYVQPFSMHELEGTVPWRIIESQNVVGVLRGNGRSDEVIVIGAHYDGQGMEGQANLGRDEPHIATEDRIWNSAIDNAVSASALIEIAQHLISSNVVLDRTIAFVAFGAEESALNGSTHFASFLPANIANVKAMINMEQIVGDPDMEFLYTTYGTSAAFPKIRENVLKNEELTLTPFYPGVLANTDTYPFVLRHIPSITIGTGGGEKVHLPEDEADGLDYALLRERVTFIAKYLTALVNTDHDISFTGDLSGHYGVAGGSATPVEIQQRGVDVRDAFKVTAIVRGAPGERAGMRVGDMIFAINDSPIVAQKYYQGLEDLIPEEIHCKTNVLRVSRGDETLTLTLLPVCVD